jgi:uncharacterized protein YkwD
LSGPAAATPAPGLDAEPRGPSSAEFPSSFDTDRQSFSQELLAAHNRWRQRYGVEALSWSPAVAAHAQEWADRLAADGMKLRHRQPNPYGENLYWSKGKARTPAEVVDAWGAEERFFDPKANNWWPKAGHFSQMVWRSTRRLGCGVARSGAEEIWVCNYDPPGNIRGQRPY